MSLHERSTELQQLDEIAARADRGAGSMVLVTGEAGIGKTALVREFANRHPEYRTLCGYAEPEANVQPLGVIHDLAIAARGSLLQAVRDSMPAWRLYEALLEDLATLGALPLIWIEDVQWADQATVEALRYLLRRCASLRVMLIVTLRSDDVRTAAVRARLLDSVPLDHWHELRLDRLSQPTVERVAKAAGFDGPELFRLTKGNPLELVSMLRWTRDSVPESLTRLALQKLADLDSDSAALIRQLAVHPERVEATWLRQLPQATPQALLVCSQQRWLAESDGYWSFEHELLRRAVRDAMSPEERRPLHALLLTLPLTAVQATFHAQAAGDGPRLREEAPRAAEQAIRAGAYREAAAYWRLALDHATPSPAQSAHWNDRLGWCLVHAGDIQGGRMAFERGYAGWRSLSDRSNMLRSMASALRWPLRVRLGMDLFSDGELETALTTAAEADLPFESAIVEIEQGRRAAHRYDFERVRALIASVRARGRFLSEVAQSTELRSWIAWLEGYYLCEVPTDDLAALASSASRLNLEHIVGQVLLMRYTFAMMQFDLSEAERVVAEGLSHADRRDLPSLTEQFRGPASYLSFERGRYEDALAQVDHALAAMRGVPMRANFISITRELALARTGHERTASVLTGQPDASIRSGNLQVLVTTLCRLAEIAWLSGDDVQAAEHMREAHLWFERLGSRRPIRFLESIEWLEVLLNPVGGPVPPYSREADGPARARCEVWLARGMPYQAAMALAGGSAASRKRALGMLRSIGAKGAIDRLHAVWQVAGVSRIPRGPNTHSRSNPAELTRREMQLLDMMVEGLGNQDIAKRLHRSVRTIERHVSAILAKTRSRTRLEAVAWSRRARDAAIGPQRTVSRKK